MTDKEKAEEYVVCNHCANYMLGKCHSKKCVKLYLDGLAEGRKDRNCVNCSNHGKQFEVMKLEKENARLSKMLEIVLPKALEHENHIFYEHKRTLEQYRAELEKRVREN